MQTDSAATAARRSVGWVGLAVASAGWGIAAQYHAGAPWLLHPEHPWHWWVQTAFFAGIALGRWSK